MPDIVVTSTEMKEADRRTIEVCGVPGLVLMEKAAEAVAAAVYRRLPAGALVAVLAGGGNNGGDGLAVARLLSLHGVAVTVVAAWDRERMTPDCAHQLGAVEKLGIRIVPIDAVDDAREVLRWADVWVDAVLGIGLTGQVRGRPLALLTMASAMRARRRRSLRVVAIDVPSGIDSDSGALLGPVVRADLTVAVQAWKWGLILPPSMAYAGEVRVANAGIEIERDDKTEIVDASLAQKLYRRPDAAAHKGSQGHVLVVAGSASMPGAAALCARAALRSGAGLVTLAAPLAVRALALMRTPELIGCEVDELPHELETRFDAIVIGPGLEQSDAVASVVASILARRGDIHVVVDASALIPAMSAKLDARVVLTPHPGELARILSMRTAEVVAGLRQAAHEVRERSGAVVVAKTAGALVIGRRSRFVLPGSPGMATAGSGDVLAGIVGAMAARHRAERAAVLGVWLHARAGRAAEKVVGVESMTASDLIDALPHAFADLRGAHGPR